MVSQHRVSAYLQTGQTTCHDARVKKVYLWLEALAHREFLEGSAEHSGRLIRFIPAADSVRFRPAIPVRSGFCYGSGHCLEVVAILFRPESRRKVSFFRTIYALRLNYVTS